MQPFYSLIASIAALAFGPLVAWIAPEDLKSSKILRVLVVVTVLVFIGLEVANHAQHIDFVSFGIIMVVSAVVTQVLENIVTRKMGGDNSASHALTIAAIVIGMAGHAVMDGVVLRKSFFYLPMAIILHRLPVSLLIWQMLGDQGRPALAYGLMALIAVGTAVGYYWSDALISSHNSFQYIQAIVAGALLHVVVHHRAHHGKKGAA